ncbi:MAG TPA: hypothetical protein VK887_01175 [Pseudonocardiaceae bacterium]|nr:hypothetical protein [Pseudonocardiaceae bacterium]
MPRRNVPRRARRATPPPLGGGPGWAQPESGPDGEWVVRTVPAEQAVKSYRCPGCDHEIGPGTAHVVAWPAGEQGSLADRRHWHTSCWAARGRRAPTRRHW